ncbi:DUF4236 domain-containing protein [Pigmentiphaga sp.]|uniref:DUF4236 domain-containing protein n=1 Tax=Pigmentiphaga sp. TaxID=1977564 RepID=UPI0025F191D3|nr:DUF4236 domain-containing protein [Pigmentiphaga sp.]
MALRFRRSIKLAPGIRMNVSGSGVSWTLGPRGATVGIGKRGTRLNTSFMGLSSSQDLSRPPSRPQYALSPPTRSIPVTCSVDNDGVLSFQDEHGNTLDDALIEIAKKQNRAAILGLIQRKCDQINGELDGLTTIHLHTPSPHTPPRFHPESYLEPTPIAPMPPRPRWWEKFLTKRLAKLEALHRQALAEHQIRVVAWQMEKTKHEQEQAAKERLVEEDIYTDTAAMERWLEANLQEIAWPRETLVALEIADEGCHILLDVDLPEIEDMPSKLAAVPARGLRLSVKELPPAQVRKRYMAHVHGIAFRLIGETFAALPIVQRITLSGFSQRHDPSTGQLRNDYLYSVSVNREAWSHIDFAQLSAIDVVEALGRFELRRQMSKTGIFKPIEPL